MICPTTVPDNNSFVIAARQLRDQGIIKQEDYLALRARQTLRV